MSWLSKYFKQRCNFYHEIRPCVKAIDKKKFKYHQIFSINTLITAANAHKKLAK